MKKHSTKEKQCCICGKDKNLYSQTPVSGPYIIKIYCDECLPA